MKKPAILMLLLILGAPALHTAAQDANPIAFGPYVQNVTHNSAVISWSTQTDGITVEGPDGVQHLPRYETHEMHLTRLNPDTEYTYDVLRDGSDHGKGMFRTFFRGVQPFSFVAFGDTRTRHDVHQRIVDRIRAEEGIRLVFNTGDLVSHGANLEDWRHFFRINRALMRETPYYPVLGNHEHNAVYYYDFFNLPNNEKYYTVSLGDALFIALDSEGDEYATPAYLKDENKDYFWGNYLKSYFEEQREWLAHMLDMHKDAGYVFVMFHKPLYSVMSSRVDGSRLFREYWADLFEAHNVQVVFTGHDHHYHRAENNGTQYITTGGGGAPLYDIDAPQPETVTYKKIEHYVRVDVKEKHADITAIDIDGKVIDKLSVKRR